MAMVGGEDLGRPGEGPGPLLSGDLRSWLEALRRVPAQALPQGVPVSLGILSVLIQGLDQVRAMERMARALAARGVPVVRAGNPLSAHPDRYVLEMLHPRTLEAYRVAAPMTDAEHLALVRVMRSGGPEGLPQVLQYGRPSEVFRAVRTALGLGR